MPTPDEVTAALSRLARVQSGEHPSVVYSTGRARFYESAIDHDRRVLAADYPRLLAERDSLRAALQAIVDNCDCSENVEPCANCLRAALERIADFADKHTTAVDWQPLIDAARAALGEQP